MAQRVEQRADEAHVVAAARPAAVVPPAADPIRVGHGEPLVFRQLGEAGVPRDAPSLAAGRMKDEHQRNGSARPIGGGEVEEEGAPVPRDLQVSLLLDPGR